MAQTPGIAWPLVVAGAMYINPVPGCSRAKDTPGLNVTMTLVAPQAIQIGMTPVVV